MHARKLLIIAVLATAGCRPEASVPSASSAPIPAEQYVPRANELYVRRDVPPVFADDTATLTVAFPISNDGTTPLTFTGVRKSCGCSDAELTKTTLNPGEEATLNVAVRTPGRFGEQRITCYVDEAGGKTWVCDLHTTIHQRFRFDPLATHFGHTRPPRAVADQQATHRPISGRLSGQLAGVKGLRKLTPLPFPQGGNRLENEDGMNGNDSGQKLSIGGVRSSAAVYGLTLAAVAAAGLLRWLFDPSLGDHLPFVTFFVAVAVASWAGGLRPALLATWLGFVVALYFFIPPRHSFTLPSGPHLFGLAMYFMVSFAFAGFGEALHAARRRAMRERVKVLAEQERFRLAADAVNGIIYEFDIQTGHVERQRGLYEILGYRADEVPPTAAWWLEQIHPDDREAIQKRFAELTGNSIVSEYRVRHKDGRWLHVEDRAVLLRGNDGHPVKMFGCTVDVTDRRAAVAKEQKASVQVVALMESLTEGFCVLDREYRFSYVNAAAEKSNGMGRDELLGRTQWEAFPQCVGTVLEREFRRAMVERVTTEFENHYAPWDRWFALKAYPAPDGGICVLYRDITDRKRVEQALTERTALLNGVLEGTTDVIFVKDLNGRMLLANAAFAAAARSTPEQLVGKTDEELFPPHVAAAIRQHEEAVLAGGSPVQIEETIPGAGEARVFLTLKTPLRDGSGRVVGVLGISRDVTERKRAEEERRLLASIVENSSDFIGISDAEGNPVYGNRAAMKLVGIEGIEQLRRSKIVDYFVPEQRQFVAEVVLPAVIKDGRWCGELTFRHFVTGATIPVLYDLFRVDDPATGRPINFATITRDLTERKRIEAERESEQKTLATVVERCPFGIYIVDDEFRMMHVNTPSENVAFVNVRPLIGRLFDEVVRIVWPEPVAADVINIFRHTFATGESYSSREFVTRRADTGQTEGYEWEAHRITLPSGRHGVVCYYFDATRLRQAEEKLRESESRFTVALKNSRILVYTTDADLRYTWMHNPHPAFNSVDVVGRRDDELLPPEQAAPLTAVKLDVLNSGVGRRAEFAVEVNGERAVYDLTVEPLRDGTGGVVGVTVAAMEITDRKREEAALKVSEVHYRRLFESAKDGILILDADAATITDANPFMAELLGYSQDEFVGKELWQIGLFKDAEASKAAMRELQEEGYIRYEDLPLATKAGRPINVEFVSNVYGENGETVIQCNVRDITIRRKTEQALAKALIYADDIVATLREPFVVLDRDLRVKTANRSFYDSFHVSKGETENQFVYDLGNGQWDIPALRTLLDQVLSRNKSVHDFEVEHTFPALGRKTMLLNARPFPPDSKHPELILLAVEDVSAVRERADELAEVNRRKDEFLATLAHELRNPLAPLRNGLQIMKLAGGNPDAVEKSRGMMERQVGQMTHLIDDLMDLSRINGGKIVLQKARLKMSDVVQDAVDTSRSLIEERGHALVVDVPPEPLYVDADRTRLAQVFGNLLNNAAKYTETGGRIRVAVERQGSDVVVAVEDNGVGIPAHMLTRVFDMFAQVDRSLEKSQGGLGIGLNIVKRLAELHDGSIVAESGGHGAGSRFVVRLPVVLTVTTDGPDDDNNVPMAKPARRRILVVDDNVDGAGSLAMMLDFMGNETQTAFNGLEAVAVAESFRPDVILMDIGMPKLNGYEACRRIRERPWGRDIVIVAQTGWGQDEDRKKSSDAGFDHHLVKPVETGALMKLLAGLKTVTA